MDGQKSRALNISQHLAKHLRDIHFGGNWTTSSLRDALTGISWQLAVKQVYGLNSIATLSFHASYYVAVLLKVLQGGPLDAKDEYSFQLPAIQSQEDWDRLLDRIWQDAEAAAGMLEQLEDAHLTENFTDPKYGSWFRNIAGIIEHMHYHLGQIVVIRKILERSEEDRIQ